MLTRRHLRIKVMQALYAFFGSYSDRVDIGEKELLNSVGRIYELYIWQFSLLLEVFDYARNRVEEARQKFLPTEEDLNPNMRFIDNRVALLLKDHPGLQKEISRFRINWADHKELFRGLYQNIRESSDYIEYLSSEDSGYLADKEYLIRLFKRSILPFEGIADFFEEKNIYWADDYVPVGMMVLKTLKSFPDNPGLPEMLARFDGFAVDGADEDRQFIVDLYRKTIVHSAEYEKMIAAKAENWELDRIATIDMILLKMALAEFLEFTSVPLKVTMNEYIEISKEYSTPKSKIFINGLLDKLRDELKAGDKIRKTGRGLKE